jgi:AbrB family looped-hinge helix DNA binding protein
MTYHARISSKGQITLPAELRHRLGLGEGDAVEFFLDHEGRVFVRPRNRPPTAILDVAVPAAEQRHQLSDDEAIAVAVAERNARSMSRKGRSK